MDRTDRKKHYLIKVAMWGDDKQFERDFCEKARYEHLQLNRNKQYFQWAASGEVLGGVKKSLRPVKVGSGEDVPGF